MKTILLFTAGILFSINTIAQTGLKSATYVINKSGKIILYSLIRIIKKEPL